MSARDRRGGFTLLETVVATTIIGLVAVSTLAALSGELRTTGKSKAVLEATALAEERLALLRLLTPDDLYPLADSLKQGRFGEPFEAYEWTVTVDEVGELGAVSLELGAGRGQGSPHTAHRTPHLGLYDVTVNVAGDQSSVEFRTRIYHASRRGAGGGGR